MSIDPEVVSVFLEEAGETLRELSVPCTRNEVLRCLEGLLRSCELVGAPIGKDPLRAAITVARDPGSTNPQVMASLAALRAPLTEDLRRLAALAGRPFDVPPFPVGIVEAERKPWWRFW